MCANIITNHPMSISYLFIIAKKKPKNTRTLCCYFTQSIEYDTICICNINTLCAGKPSRPRHTQADPGRPRQTQADPGRPRQTQADPGRPRQTQADLGRPMYTQSAYPGTPSRHTQSA